MPPASSPAATLRLPTAIFLSFNLGFALSVYHQLALFFCYFLRIPLDSHRRFSEICRPTWMGLLAGLAVRTETGKVKFAQ
jgi:hypothetical protein